VRRFDRILHPGWPLAWGLAACLAGTAKTGGAAWLPPLGWAALAAVTLSGLIATLRHRRDRKLLHLYVQAEDRARTLELLIKLLREDRDTAHSALDSTSAETARARQMLREICSGELLAMKSQFVSGVGHELRTPLASIKAYTEMLIDGEARDDRTRAEFYEIIQSESNRLSRLIENILNISRIEAGVANADLHAHDLGAILAEAVHAVDLQARLKRVTISAPSVPASLPAVRCDRELLLQVVVNLLANAVRHTPDGSTVEAHLDASTDGHTVRLRVTDHGPAIPAESLPFAFDKFYMGPASDGRAVHGTGLGLSMVRHVVETLHGGRAFVEPLPDGAGNHFGFELESCAPAPETEARGGAERTAAPRPRNNTTRENTHAH
jgi:signal transduction histidine kinase